jgi:hypothetical protein
MNQIQIDLRIYRDEKYILQLEIEILTFNSKMKELERKVLQVI